MKPKKSFRLWFILLAVLFLTPWPVAYAYDNDAAADSVVRIEAAEPSAAPRMTVFGGAVGSVFPGDLFYIDASGTNTASAANLYLTNAGELIHHYRNLILEVGIYVESDNVLWQKLYRENGAVSDTYLTLRDGQVGFILDSHARYRITIEGGSFYSNIGNAAEAGMSPRFYLKVD